MRRTWIGLECDDCGDLFPKGRTGIAAPCDGAIYTWTMLRNEANSTGWQRFGGHDFCPACEKKHRNQMARDAAARIGGH